MTDKNLCGAWQLVSFVITHSDNRQDVYPFGPDATGLLIYSPDGHMSAILSRANRANLATGRLENSARADDASKAQAFDAYLSYGGHYHLEGDEVVHHVEYAMMPDIIGVENRRHLSWLDDHTIALSYQITPKSGVTRTYCLTWKRPT